MTGTRRPVATAVRGAEFTRSQEHPAVVRWRPLRIDDWSVAAKVVAVLAIPAAIAAVFGFAQVQNQLATAGRDATAVSQAGVLQPAWNVLAAADDVMNSADAAAPARLVSAVDTLTEARDSSSLDDDQRSEISSLLSAAQQIADHPGAESQAASEEIGRTLSDVASDIHSSNIDITDRVSAFREIVTARLALGDQRWTASHPSAIATVNTTTAAAEMGAEAVALSRVGGDAGVVEAVGVLLDRNSGRLSQLSHEGVSSASALTTTAQRYDEAAASATDAITTAMSDAALQARSQALLVTGLVLGLLLVGLAAALVVARSLTRPLSAVRGAAHEIADTHLPRDVADVLAGNALQTMPRIPVGSTEEIGQLARAVESMYARARELATAQATLRQQVAGMFETLSRRSNALVDRQLSLVEKLESDEPDAQRLAQLFELDHLAARMRRNGESLLVLAGAKGRAARARQLSVVDAARAASAEVADYQRVVIGDIGTQQVSAGVSSDLIHLFAELIDNALSYSPPNTDVVVVGARTADGGMLVEILDEGLGIDDSEREQLNAVLRSSSDLTAESARRMGLFVVGRLAAMHGIAVTLRPNPAGGTIAAVALPPAVLVLGRDGGPRPSFAAPASPAAGGARLAPVADISERAVARDERPGDPARPTLARRERGVSAPVTAALAGPASAAAVPAAAPATTGLPVLPTRRPGSTRTPGAAATPATPVQTSPPRGTPRPRDPTSGVGRGDVGGDGRRRARHRAARDHPSVRHSAPGRRRARAEHHDQPAGPVRR